MRNEPLKIIVTSAGTASAISVIRALKNQTDLAIHIIAVDLDPIAPGLFLADEKYTLPAVKSPDYIPRLMELAEHTGATVLIPIYSREIELIASKKTDFREKGIITYLPDPLVIATCNDKRRMNDLAQKLGIRVPKLYEVQSIDNITDSQLPLFVKPNTGSSSLGAELVRSKSRLKELLSSGQDLIIQEYIEAEEITIDVLCDSFHNPIVVAPRLRMVTKSGQTIKGKTLSSAKYLKIVETICKQFQLVGVCNIQFFTKDDELTFIEVNPRFAAGGLMLTVAAGANIPLLLLKLAHNIHIEDSECHTFPDYVMSRYWNEIILDEHGKQL